MTTEQPENDPNQRPGESGQQGGDSPYGRTPPPPGGGGPYGNPPPPGGYGDEKGGSPYDNPYGDQTGAADPLAGMPPLASRGKRLLARIIDGLIISIPVGLVMGLVLGFGSYNSTDTGGSYGQQGIYALVYLVYEGIMLTRSGQTVGKKLMKIRVAVLSNGAVPRGSTGWLRAAVYNVPPLVPCIGFLFWLVNVLFCTWDKPYQQCLHDKAVKTVVVAAS